MKIEQNNASIEQEKKSVTVHGRPDNYKQYYKSKIEKKT